jgi:hypothetical protein
MQFRGGPRERGHGRGRRAGGETGSSLDTREAPRRLAVWESKKELEMRMWSSMGIAAGALFLASAAAAQTVVLGADLTAENAACFQIEECDPVEGCVTEPGCGGLAKHRTQGNRLREFRVLGEVFRSLADGLPAEALAALQGNTAGCVAGEEPGSLECGACIIAPAVEFAGVMEAECTIANPITFRVRNLSGTVRYSEAVSDLACFYEDGVFSFADDGHPLDVCGSGFRVRVRGGAAANHPLSALTAGWQLCAAQNGSEICAPFLPE